MKKHLIFLIALPFLFACGGSNKQATSLEDSLARVYNELDEKDTIIRSKEKALSEFIKSFNEIQSNLNQIKAKERVLSMHNKDIELSASAKDQIINDIQFIYGQMNKNKQHLASITKRLKTADMTIDYLETAIENLNVQIRNNENEIADLKAHLEHLNVDFTNLQDMYKNLQETYAEEKVELDQKTKILNTVYYIVGTADYLKKKGVITKKGGFVAELNKDFNSANFKQIDISKLTEIPLKNVATASILTPHPSDSYKIIPSGGNDKLFVVRDPQKFWKNSHYLVIEID